MQIASVYFWVMTIGLERSGSKDFGRHHPRHHYPVITP